MGYYQDKDEAEYYDSWEGERDMDYEMNINNPHWVQPPDSYYRDKHVPAKQFIRQAMAESAQRRADEAQAAALGGRLSKDGNTILIPVMTEPEKVEAKDRYAINKAAKVGAQIECACCGKKLTKTNYQQAFCPPIIRHQGKWYRCKDKYHNATNPIRAARANAILGVS